MMTPSSCNRQVWRTRVHWLSHRDDLRSRPSGNSVMGQDQIGQSSADKRVVTVRYLADMG